MSRTPMLTPWFTSWRADAQATLRLFCFPYAGGAANLFRAWPEQLPASVEVCAVQLPGRGSRLLEPPITRIPRLVRALALAIVPLLDKPFAFFGHSLGAMLSYELARHLKTEHAIEPVHLFVSGCHAPCLLKKEPQTYDLPEAAFLAELRRLNGTPAEILEHPELMPLLMPVLRADFELAQTYKYTAGALLDCPISAYGGLSDKEVSRAELQRWQELTTAQFLLRMFAGEHFFIQQPEARFLRAFSQDLGKVVSQLSR